MHVLAAVIHVCGISIVKHMKSIMKFLHSCCPPLDVQTAWLLMQVLHAVLRHAWPRIHAYQSDCTYIIRECAIRMMPPSTSSSASSIFDACLYDEISTDVTNKDVTNKGLKTEEFLKFKPVTLGIPALPTRSESLDLIKTCEEMLQAIFCEPL